MKLILKTFKLLTVFLLVLGLTGCSDDDNNGPIDPSTLNIFEIASSNANLTRLVAALQSGDGDLVNVLSGPGPFTVLAPTNVAFSNYLSANGYTSLDEVPTDLLSQILLNHVISGEVSSTVLSTEGSGYTNTNALGAGGNNLSLFYDTSSGVTFNSSASVTTNGADIEANNGVIHIIDAVLELPTVVDHALNNSEFSSLATALGTADGGLVGVLGEDGPFTVLAPNNAAFTTFLNGTPLSSVDTGDLSQILLNHVLNGIILSTDLVNSNVNYTRTLANGPLDLNMNPTTLSLYYNTSTGNVIFNGISEVAIADIVGTNGIIHAVDTVIALPTIATFATADPNFSILEEALTTETPGTDFAAILGRTGVNNSDGFDPSFTVFAPVDAAFTDLLATNPEWNTLADVGEINLTTYLLHHVIQEANIKSSDLTPDGITTAGTLIGLDIDITLPGTSPNIADVTDGAGNTDIGIIAVDVQAVNGVIHALNKVLLPF